MNKLLFLIPILLITVSCSSTYQLVSIENPSESIIEVQGNKDDLFLKANEWMVQTFNNAKSVIQYQDKEQGTILGKYLLFSNKTTGLYGVEAGSEIFAIIKVAVKDNAAKINIEPQGEWHYDKSGWTIYKYSPEQAQNDIDELIKNFETFMSKQSSDW